LGHSELNDLLRDARVQSECLEDPGLNKHVSSDRWAAVVRQFAYRTYFARLYAAASRNSDIRGAVIPYLDYCLYGIAALGSPFGGTPWCGITMRTGDALLTHHTSIRSVAIRSLCKNKTIRGLFTIDPRMEGRSTQLREGGRGMLRYVGDPVAIAATGDRTKMRAALAVSDVTTVVLIFGSLDERKGIDCLLTGLLKLDPNIPLTLLLVGKQSKSIQALLATPRFRSLWSAGRIKSIERYVDETELADALAGADAAWLGYHGHQHMSGVFQLAAAHGLPIIATREGAIGFMANRVSLCTAIDPQDPAQVATALCDLALRPRVRRAPAEIRDLLATNSRERFGAAIAAVFS
jgi:glycosyltransferase involved in cell wall biosynthesis